MLDKLFFFSIILNFATRFSLFYSSKQRLCTTVADLPLNLECNAGKLE